MKKLIRIGGILGVLIFLTIVMTQCSWMYGDDDIVEEGLRYYPHAIFKTCFAADYTWPADSTSAVLDIPDSCGGYCVTELGGYIGRGAPCPFMVSLPESSAVYSEGALPEHAQIETYHLVLNIGKTLKEDTNIAMDHYYSVGSNRFVQILVTVNCSEENPHFYSENGKLYKKTDDSLVDGFFYQSDFSE